MPEPQCRQQYLCEYFSGEDYSQNEAPCGICDTCNHAQGVQQRLESYEESVSKRRDKGPIVALSPADLDIIIDAVAGLTRPVGKSNLAKALRGSRAKVLRRGGLLKLLEHGSLQHYSEASIVAAIEGLLNEGRLERRGAKYPTVWLAGRPVRQKNTDEAASKSKKATTAVGGVLGRALENYRKRQAKALNWKPYMVFHRKAIRAICAAPPNSLWELEQVPGLGPAKVERFGDDILLLIRRHT